MPGTDIDNLNNAIEQAEARYEKLVLLVGESGSSKTQLLRALVDANGCPLVNVNRDDFRSPSGRFNVERTMGLEPRLPGCKPGVFPWDEQPLLYVISHSSIVNSHLSFVICHLSLTRPEYAQHADGQ